MSKTIKTILRYLILWPLILLIFTFATGFLVELYMSRFQIPNDHPPFLGFNINYLSSFLFTLSFLSINLNTGIWALNRFPVISWKRVWMHIGIQLSSAHVAFIVGILLNGIVFFHEGSAVEQDLSFLFFVYVMSMTAAIIFNLMYYIGSLYRNLLVQSRQSAEHQLAALKNQINPHFLFNSLNSIASLIRINPEKAETVTEDLAELFRYSLRAGKQHVTSLKDEVESIETYFRIEKARFGDRLSLHIQIHSSFSETAIPSLILQPLVENSVKHAANSMLDSCVITVDAIQKKNGIWISINDNGPGFPQVPRDTIFEKGTGLKNVNERLKFTFGERSELHLEKNSVSFLLPS